VAIFDAAATVVAEAGGTIAGGHTIRNPEPIFGLAVQGVVDPARVFRKGGGRPGDVLVLSKPIGTGLALAGGSADDKAEAIAGMRRLNRAASESCNRWVRGAAAVSPCSFTVGEGRAECAGRHRHRRVTHVRRCVGCRARRSHRR
jgi:selenide,water dikinase